MKNKTNVFIAIVMVATLFLAACSPKVETPVEADTAIEELEKTTAGETEPVHQIVIGLSEPSLGWPYIAAFVKELEGVIAKSSANVKLITLSADGSIEKQTNDINDLIVQGVDIIMVCSLDGQAVIPAIKAAYDAGIPVLAVSNEPFAEGQKYLTAYSGPDDYVQGQIAAEIMVDALKKQGKTEGNIIMIEGTAGQSTTQLRADGFNTKLAEIAPGVKVIDQQPCDWDSALEKTATQAFITKYGDQIDGIFAQGNGNSVGEAVTEAGLSIPVVCTGLSQANYDGIKSGKVYGTMAQSPFIDASQALELGLKIVNGEPLDQKRYIIPMPVVTSDNISQFTPDY
jgi:ribose transport system substrate-binding protein